jgi:hypothetical protein
LVVVAAKLLDQCIRSGDFWAIGPLLLLGLVLTLVTIIVSRVVSMATFPTLSWLGNIGMNMAMNFYSSKINEMVFSISETTCRE